MVKVYEIKQSVFADNDRQAELLRKEMKEKGTFLLNLMSSPGAGKTTTLEKTMELLRDEMKIFTDCLSDTRMMTKRRERSAYIITRSARNAE